ncbi:MAG: 3-carboxy-cis,cis-muconate cycloisomerase [Terriglobales bacterium]
MRLIDSLATTEELAKLFSDESLLEAMLQFEVALARVEARIGIIPQIAAEKIAAAAKPELFDTAILAIDSLRAGTPAIPFVKALRERVHVADPVSANFVHWGATSQDVVDTAMVLLLKQTQPGFETNLKRLEKSLRQLSDKHAHTVMLGRTLMQPAPPITFGLKAAAWLGAIYRAHNKLKDNFTDALILQCGGASGTLAFLGDNGIAVGQALAEDLGLAYPEAPWHTQRDRLAALMCACGVLTGSLAKMARDISLLAQSEIREVAEGETSGRGGSSTMPHKHNPIGCMLTLTAANRVPNLVAAFLSGMVQEHERGAGGWQAEWPTVVAIIQATGLAIDSMAEVAEGLIVDPARMRFNIDATHGVIFAENAMMILSPRIGREAAHKLLEDAARRAVSECRRLSEILAEMPEVTRYLDAANLSDLEVSELYIGVAEQFRQRLLLSSTPDLRSKKE